MFCEVKNDYGFSPWKSRKDKEYINAKRPKSTPLKPKKTKRDHTQPKQNEKVWMCYVNNEGSAVITFHAHTVL